MEIKGNLSGVRKTCLAEIEAFAELQPSGRSFMSEELCLAMLRFTHQYNRELAIYLDARGKVIAASLGDFATVQISDFGNINHKIRCIHTHPKGAAILSEADITAARSKNFAAMACLAVNAEGGFWGASLLLHGEEDELYFNKIEHLCAYEMPVIRNYEYIENERDNKALLISLSEGRSAAIVKNSLEELASLAETAGIEVLNSYMQNAQKPVAATYIGSGKVDELRMEAQLLGAGMLIFDDEISPTQMHNLELLTGLRIIDRTMLILDIFASRARSNEGKLQVELAQLKYLFPRLLGRGTQLSRLGGGIGTRGPGETKLETDRRKIRIRISELEERLEKVENARSVQRSKRERNAVPTVALVGYTNAGKTTLLNALSGEESFSADLLFATLDTLTRRIEPENGQAYLLSDTVGFIRRLPHHLIAAFRATLNELRYADVLLHVMDASSPEAEEQAVAVESVLKDLKLEDKPVIPVFNKCDRKFDEFSPFFNKYPDAVYISALTHQGFDNLAEKIENAINKEQGKKKYSVLLPYEKAAASALIYANTEVLACNYEAEGTAMLFIADKQFIEKLTRQGIECKEED